VGISSAVYTTLEPFVTDPVFEQSIEDIRHEMDNVNSEIGLINTIIGLLQQLSATLTALVTASDGASTQIATVLGFWDHLEEDLTDLVTDIDTILSDVSDPASIDRSISEIQDAQDSWNDVEDFMKLIKDIDYTVLQIGAIPLSTSGPVTA
jgi:prefoldin subunit 5